MREGGGSGHDRCPAILHRVWKRNEQRETFLTSAQLHPGLLSATGQRLGNVAHADHAGVQKGDRGRFRGLARRLFSPVGRMSLD